MCELLQIIRIAGFALCVVAGLTAVLSANAYCKKNGINMNTFEGMFEMYRRVFRFENKRLSILMLSTTYGGAVLMVGVAAITFWGQAQGCDFHINRLAR